MEISRLAPAPDALGAAESIGGQGRVAEEAPYGANLSADDLAFQHSLAAAVQGPDEVSQVVSAVFEPLDHINNEAAALADYAESALESQNTLTPGEMVALTVRSQEFMFHSQLTANIANRMADGVQQLFRQQS